MMLPDLALGPEWAVLELLCLGLTTPEEQAMFDELFKANLNWGELLEQSLRHKMLPMLAFHTLTNKSVRESIPSPMRVHLQSVLDVNRHKTTIFRREAARIVSALREQGVHIAGRKGIVFEASLYNGNGSRRLGYDIDFLITPQDRDTVIDTLSQLGYQMGYYDKQAYEVKPHDRKTLMIYQLNPDHIIPMTFVTGDPVVPCVEADCANSLTWARSPFDIPTEVVLDEVFYQAIPGVPETAMPSLSPRFQFICTVLHLYREAWFERWLDWNQDVDLMKFGDVVRLWRVDQKTLADAEFIQLLEEYNLTEAVVWVLEHLDRTLHTEIVVTLGLNGRATDEFLFSARASGGKTLKWKGTMRERLHCKERRQLFGEVL